MFSRAAAATSGRADLASDGDCGKCRTSAEAIKPATSIGCYPDWFERCFERASENVEICLLKQGKATGRDVRFELATRPLFCQLGDFVVAKLPLRVAGLRGYTPEVPEEESAYDRMFAQILPREFDAIYLNSVRPETLLWRYLQSSRQIQKAFHFYSPGGPLPHFLIRLSGSFDSYMKRFSPKTRKNRLREIKILQGRGDLKLIRVTEASEIDGFLQAAYGISQKTRQFRRFGWGVAARDPRLVKNELQRLAQQGELRSYLLTCGNVPCSYILGQQSSSTFYPIAAGVDPGWKDYSAGTVLLLLALEDLLRENSPAFYDLGPYVKHKQFFATESYLEADVWLFRRRAYPLLASSIYRACNLASMTGGAVLERLGLKSRVTQLMRRLDFVTGRIGSRNGLRAA